VSANDDKIAWYESDGKPDPQFTERVITEDPDGGGPLQGFADGATFVFATDVDDDGDTDVLSASSYDDKITWYENTTPLPDIPTLSQWDLVAMTLLVLTAGTLIYARQRGVSSIAG